MSPTNVFTEMYGSLGIHWASSIPAFLALACTPFPFLFYKFGEKIRKRCKYAAEAARVLEEMRAERNSSFAVTGEEGEDQYWEEAESPIEGRREADPEKGESRRDHGVLRGDGGGPSGTESEMEETKVRA